MIGRQLLAPDGGRLEHLVDGAGHVAQVVAAQAPVVHLGGQFALLSRWRQRAIDRHRLRVQRQCVLVAPAVVHVDGQVAQAQGDVVMAGRQDAAADRQRFFVVLHRLRRLAGAILGDGEVVQRIRQAEFVERSRAAQAGDDGLCMADAVIHAAHVGQGHCVRHPHRQGLSVVVPKCLAHALPRRACQRLRSLVVLAVAQQFRTGHLQLRAGDLRLRERRCVRAQPGLVGLQVLFEPVRIIGLQAHLALAEPGLEHLVRLRWRQ